MKNFPSVSVIIPSYNRFSFLLDAVDSVKRQNYPNLEIIIVNDGSTEKSYYDHVFENNTIVINLEQNQKEIHGFGPGSIRNFGTQKASGEYLAFLDDDDIWLDNKLINQITEMKNNNFLLSSTEGYYGEGRYNPSEKYPLYNKEKYIKDYKYLYKDTNFLKNNKLPKIWNSEFTNIWNCFITSSVVVQKELFNNLGGFRNLPMWADYDCWKGLQQLTDSIYIDEPLFYFDGLHGHGRNYEK
tara:strand:+ start:36360 stop:37082 length:723 start_codon:yes stop_codon:yes gene_type:complete